jgi:ABC-2 type transport system ATP-binding protein
MWYIYDALYKTADSHYALRIKKKLIRQGYLDLKKELNGRSIKEPLYKEKIGMIEIKNFTKVYSGSDKKAVDNLSLTVPGGTVYGFLGHNGAGKSTTIKSLVGIQTITSGKIIVEGYDVEKQSVEAKLRIGYVSDNHAVYERLTGREYINYIADLYMVNQKDRDERIDKYVKMFKLEDAIDREAKSYSHGMKQKLVIIASLIHDPKVWVLDEPLTGLDPTSSFQIKECMREHANRGNIVFFSSHIIEVVEKICDHICIINHGKLVCQYSMKEIHDQGISLEELYMKYLYVEDEHKGA